MITTTALH